MVEGGTLLGSDDIGDDTHILCWKDIERSEYEVYLATLAEEGFVAKQGYAYSIGENVYTLLCGEKADLFVSYLANEQTLRVYGEKANSALYPSPDQEAFVPVDGAAPTLWQLETDWKKGNAGMSYVIRVSDGSFVIIDGGFDSQTEVDHLYHFLKEKSDLEKPVISAWIITHGHLDHYGAFRGMTKSYLNQLTIKAFYYNTPYEGFDNDYQNAFVNDMKQWTDAKRYGKLHSGMRFYVADARFDVIYTHEDLYPSYSDNGNDTSLVLRMQLDGKTVMFLADINASASRVIEANYPATELKSDIVQYAHHGYEGATKLLYDMIQAPTILWPMNICGWDANGEPQKVFERWIDSTVPSATTEINSYMAFQADYVKKIYVSGAGTAEFVLKNYVPTGERLPDYKTIYNERANGQTDA